MRLEPTELSVAELRQRLIGHRGPVPRRMLASLEADPRQGARDLHALLLKRRDAQRVENKRVRRLLAVERGWWESGVNAVAGVDEVGTGPLAGPVVAAAVVFPPGTSFPGVDDSKRLTPEEREAVAPVIRERASAVGIGVASVCEIDTVNVYHAGLLAMRRAVEALDPPAERVVVDARCIPELTVPQEAYTQGDARVFCVAAASIIAKIYRDALMDDLDASYPDYGFRRHKGYATPDHQEAIRLHGPCDVHRTSFGYIRQLCGEYSAKFYSLTARLETVCDGGELEAIEAEFNASRERLSDEERSKLQILLARRRRRFGL